MRAIVSCTCHCVKANDFENSFPQTEAFYSQIKVFPKTKLYNLTILGIPGQRILMARTLVTISI